MDLVTELALIAVGAIGLVIYALRTRADQERLNNDAREYIQKRVDEQDEKIEHLQKERESLITQVTDTRDKLSFAEGLSQGRLERIEKQDSHILEIHAESERMKTRVVELELLPGRLADLQTQHNKILKEFQSAKEQNATLLKQNEQLRKDLKAEREMNVSLRQQLKELGDKLDKSNEEIARLSRQLEQIKVENDGVRKQLDSIEQSNEESQSNDEAA